MEAPNKIHVQPNAHDRWFEGKIPSGLPNCLFVEYTRTDAFIEKALSWMISQGGVNDALSREMIENFKKYMKGE